MSVSPEAGDLLRSMVREVLRDVVGEEISARAGQSGRPQTRGVVVATQADLDAVVRRVLQATPQERQDLESGRLRFTLAQPQPVAQQARSGSDRPGQGAESPSTAGDAHRIARGAVTERMVEAAAKEGRELVLGKGAVLTPLARDRARSRGVKIRRESED